MKDTHRLAEILGALSLATDMAAGQPPESALGATVLSVRLGRLLGMDTAELAETYFACVTRFIGCTAGADEVAPLCLGDELSANHAFSLADPIDPDSVREYMGRWFAPDRPEAARREVIDLVLQILPEIHEYALPHCQQAIALAKRLPVPAGVVDLLAQIESRWDGLNPTRAGGEDLPLASRVIEFALVAELHRRAGGPRSMLEIAASRAGAQFDPAVCAAFARHAPELLSGFEAGSLWPLYLDAEPGAPARVDGDRLQDIAEAFADFTDNQSGWLLGHSRQVAALAYRGAEALGFEHASCRMTFLASLLHDIGRAGIANGIWDKPGPLDANESRQMRLHCLHTENILSMSAVFAPLLDMACSSQERCDGSGYHRRLRLDDRQCCLIAAANCYDALTHDRPWRAALDPGDAAEQLLAEAAAGRMPRDGVRAVLDAAGHARRFADRAYPDGLTRREVEVLEHLARGLSNKEIAARLSIAVKTADNHLQKLYRKIGASSRTAAAMYALDKGIFGN